MLCWHKACQFLLLRPHVWQHTLTTALSACFLRGAFYGWFLVGLGHGACTNHMAIQARGGCYGRRRHTCIGCLTPSLLPAITIHSYLVSQGNAPFFEGVPFCRTCWQRSSFRAAGCANMPLPVSLVTGPAESICMGPLQPFVALVFFLKGTLTFSCPHASSSIQNVYCRICTHVKEGGTPAWLISHTCGCGAPKQHDKTDSTP